MIAQLVRASERNSVAVGSDPTLKNPSVVNTICIDLFRYQPDYLCKISLEENVVTDKDNGQNEM